VVTANPSGGPGTLPFTPPADPRVAYVTLLDSQQIRAGEDWFGRLSGRSPKDATLKALVAASQISLEKFDAARGNLEEALRLDPKCSLERTFQGRLFLRLGELDKAQAAFQAGLSSADASQPLDRVLALRGVGVAQLWKGDLKAAQGMFEEGRKVAGGGKLTTLEAMLLGDLAMVSELRGDTDATLKLLRQAVDLQPDRMAPRVRFTNFAWEAKRYQEALQVLALQPLPAERDRGLRRLTLQCLLGMGKKEEAMKLAVPLFRGRQLPDELAGTWKETRGR